MPMQDKRLATIQVDIDGQWILEKLLGRDSGIEPDPVIEYGIERIIRLFDEFGIKATFFVVSKDLESAAKRDIFKKLSGLGHEIACHGSGHDYMTAMSTEMVKAEISESKYRIESALGVEVRGFKAPGFACHKETARFLEAAGYGYDSSVLPTSCAFLMESASRVRYRKASMIFAPRAPYRPARKDIYKSGDAGIIEIPVSVAPIFRTPCHMSYMIVGGSAYELFIRKILGVFKPGTLNYLFHPLDFVDSSSVKISGKIPGLSMPYIRKIDIAKRMLDLICRDYKVMISAELAKSITG